VHEGHFQIASLVGLAGDSGEEGNIGIFEIVLLLLVCWNIAGIILTFDFSITGASARHFSGYFFAYSSWALANFGHENGAMLPSTFR
jgi:hypothetical protein